MMTTAQPFRRVPRSTYLLFKLTPSRSHSLAGSGLTVEVALQRTNLEVAPR